MIIIVISGSSDRLRISVLSVTADAYENGIYLIGLLGGLNQISYAECRALSLAPQEVFTIPRNDDGHHYFMACRV